MKMCISRPVCQRLGFLLLSAVLLVSMAAMSVRLPEQRGYVFFCGNQRPVSVIPLEQETGETIYVIRMG